MNDRPAPIPAQELLNTKWRKSGPTVEQARAAMLKEAEAAKTHRLGTKVPAFIAEARAKEGNALYEEDAKIAQERHDREPAAGSRGVGGNTPVQAPRREHPIEEMLESVQTAPTVESRAEAATPIQEREAVSPPPTVSTVVPERQPIAEPEPQRKRIEEKKFVVEIFREGKDWVAELTYKNGSGMERFTANSKDELLAKLAVGKAHGTLKVRETVQRYKLGDILDTWNVFFEEVKNSHGITLEQYQALPEPSRQLIQDNIQAAAILEFKAIHTDYYAIAANFDKIAQYLNSRKVPLTLHNLEIAYRDLSEDDLLELRPAPQVPQVVQTTPAVAVSAQVATPLTEDSAAEAAVVSTTSVMVAPPVRKRGVTGLVPGQSSAVSATESARTVTEEGTEQRELSIEEARRLAKTNPEELARLAKQNRKFGRY